MNIDIRIGTSERAINDIEPNWISEQIIRRKQDGVPVCVVVTIKSGNVDMRLISGGCASGGGGRRPNVEERRIYELWEKHHLGEVDIAPGELIAFLREIT